jgi:anti-sigma regulatory factor (Ser/Thr protein kinase)
MCGTIGTARQASASGHARAAATAGRVALAIDDTPRQPASAARVPPLADPLGNDVTGRWPLRNYLELGAMPGAVPCARLHARQLLWEWGLAAELGDTAELLLSEIVTNAVKITEADGRDAPVRLWLLADRTRLLVLIWDASPLPPVRMNTSSNVENGRGLLLVETLSTRWGSFTHQHGGKVVWALAEAAGRAA